jgi:hypothetical protein
MCRNIKTLFNFEPSATGEEIEASALQFVRKLSGFAKPSKGNENAFRFITGKLSGHRFKVVTPTAVIGVRGTDFVVLVAEDGTTQVAVLDGAVEMAALDGATAAVVVPSGEGVGISAGGGAVAVVPFPRISDSALGVGATGAPRAGETEAEAREGGGQY